MGCIERSDRCAKLLITHFGNIWIGYEYASRNLIKLNRFKEALETINTGLDKCPNDPNLLSRCIHICHLEENFERALEYRAFDQLSSTQLNGYARAAENLTKLFRFEEAQAQIQAGLQKTQTTSSCS